MSILQNAQFKMIPLGQIWPITDNARVINVKETKFKELVENVRSTGVIVPVIVRPHPEKEGQYELRAGNRRYQAACEVKLTELPAIVCEMDNLTALDVTELENKYRADLKPLEEAQLMATILEAQNGDIAAAASRSGKSAHRVAMLFNVHENLCLKWVKAVNTRPVFQNWTLAHLELVARFSKNIQEGILSEVDEDDNYANISVSDLAEELDKLTHMLSEATWELDGVVVSLDGKDLLPCTKCKTRSDQDDLLWEEDKTDKKNVRCLNEVCWKQKLAASLITYIATLKGKHPNLRVGARGCSTDIETIIEKAAGMKLADTYRLSQAKKTDKGAFPCLVVRRDFTSTLEWAKNPVSDKKAAKADAPKAEEKTLKQKREELEKKRWFSVLEKLTEAVALSDYECLVPENKLLTIAALAAMYGTEFRNLNTKLETQMLAVIESQDLTDASLCRELWAIVRPKLLGTIRYAGPLSKTPAETIKQAKWLAGILNIDIQNIYIKCKDEIKEPKGWTAK